MAYQISDACVSCGACAEQCPVSAISEGDGKYEIDADACLSCGACADVDGFCKPGGCGRMWARAPTGRCVSGARGPDAQIFSSSQASMAARPSSLMGKVFSCSISLFS